jgi:hypothetical protein
MSAAPRREAGTPGGEETHGTWKGGLVGSHDTLYHSGARAAWPFVEIEGNYQVPQERVRHATQVRRGLRGVVGEGGGDGEGRDRLQGGTAPRLPKHSLHLLAPAQLAQLDGRKAAIVGHLQGGAGLEELGSHIAAPEEHCLVQGRLTISGRPPIHVTVQS